MAAIAIRKFENLVVKVTVTREFRARTWLATQLVRLAAVVLGGRVEIDTRVENDE